MPLYVLLGALQILRVLSGAVLVRAAPAVAVSPGSAVLFSAGLAAVLCDRHGLTRRTRLNPTGSAAARA
ncbi:hypothetical protein [Rudaea cellulosilytica]|uniref:hypothetical protein n=1 Tax=Rudaea cellulosilytica TaxID=540746 RepID=UPI003CCC2B80